METSGFFDAVYDEELEEYDLRYLAEQFAAYFSLFIGNGVFISPTNQLKVHAGEGLTVTVEPGWAFIDGYWYHNDELRVLNIPPNATSQLRTDSVKCRLDYANRRIHSLYFNDDTSVERSGNYYDLKLANVVVQVASIQILEADITDTRMDESVCGFVKGLMDVTSTEDLFSQYDAMFEIWFDKLKGSLGEDAATSLQAQIGFLEDLQTEVKTDLVSAMNWLLANVENLTNGILDTMEEIEANTQENMIAGALAVKELNNKNNDSFITVSNVLTGVVFNGNSGTSVTVPLTIPDGYALISVSGIVLGNLNLAPYSFACGTDSIGLTVRNLASNDLSANVRAYGLCCKTHLI